MNVQDDMDVHDFVALNLKRQLWVTFGNKDPAPGMFYSASCDGSLYLDLT